MCTSFVSPFNVNIRIPNLSLYCSGQHGLKTQSEYEYTAATEVELYNIPGDSLPSILLRKLQQALKQTHVWRDNHKLEVVETIIMTKKVIDAQGSTCQGG